MCCACMRAHCLPMPSNCDPHFTHALGGRVWQSSLTCTNPNAKQSVRAHEPMQQVCLLARRCAQACDEEKLLGHLGVVLYEYLGEEYPEVLGSILGALKSIVNVIGMTKVRALR